MSITSTNVRVSQHKQERQIIYNGVDEANMWYVCFFYDSDQNKNTKTQNNNCGSQLMLSNVGFEPTTLGEARSGEVTALIS